MLLIFPLQKGNVWARNLADFILQQTYPAHVSMKDDSVNPTIGMEIYVRNGHLHWHAHHKTLGEAILYYKGCQQAIISWYSYGPPQVLETITAWGFARRHHLADKCGLPTSKFCNLLEVQGKCPRTWINKPLKQWCDSTFGSQSKVITNTDADEHTAFSRFGFEQKLQCTMDVSSCGTASPPDLVMLSSQPWELALNLRKRQCKTV